MPRVRRCSQAGCHRLVELPNHYCQQHQEHELQYGNHHNSVGSKGESYHSYYNRTARRRNGTKVEQYNFYRTKQWSGLRQAVLDNEYYVCAYCGKTDSKIVDHTVPVEWAPVSRADVSNLHVICSSCHTMKTRWERGYYGTGDGNKLRDDVVAINDVDLINKLMHAVKPV